MSGAWLGAMMIVEISRTEDRYTALRRSEPEPFLVEPTLGAVRSALPPGMVRVPRRRWDPDHLIERWV